MSRPASTVVKFEKILRQLQRSGLSQYSLEIESIGGRAPSPVFRIVNQGNFDVLPMPATREHKTLAAALDEAFQWSESNVP